MLRCSQLITRLAAEVDDQLLCDGLAAREQGAARIGLHMVARPSVEKHVSPIMVDAAATTPAGMDRCLCVDTSYEQ